MENDHDDVTKLNFLVENYGDEAIDNTVYLCRFKRDNPASILMAVPYAKFLWQHQAIDYALEQSRWFVTHCVFIVTDCANQVIAVYEAGNECHTQNYTITKNVGVN